MYSLTEQFWQIFQLQKAQMFLGDYNQIRRLYPKSFLYDGKPAGGVSYSLQDAKEIRFHKVLTTQRHTNTTIESHDFYANEAIAREQGLEVKVDYPIAMRNSKRRYEHVLLWEISLTPFPHIDYCIFLLLALVHCFFLFRRVDDG